MIKLKKHALISIGAGLAVVLALFLLLWKNAKKVEFSKTNNSISVEKNVSPSKNQDAEIISENNSPDNRATISNVNETNQKIDNSSNNNDKGDIKNTSSEDIKNNASNDADKNDSSSQSAPKIVNRLVSWGFQKSSGRKIDTIIIHSTYNAVGSDPFDLDDIINKEYKPYGVSPHYIIDRGGKIYRLVEDQNIAYHAGESKMPDGRTNVNNFSIGIEIVTSKTAKPTDDQYSSLKYLLSYLKGKYPIKNVLGHDDIAPGRKDDPWNFDWSKIK